MNKLHALTKETASEKSKQIFKGIEKTVGRLPNIYAVMGNSANALSSYLIFSESQRSGSFNSKEIEAVALAVSEENGCNYCTGERWITRMLCGLRTRVRVRIPRDFSADEKLNVL